jgi:hypothetical protein
MLASIEGWWRVPDGTQRINLEHDFIDRFDVTYRIRRLQFVIRRLNQHGEEDLSDAVRDAVDDFKPVAYDYLNRLYASRRALSGSQLDNALIERLYLAARELPLPRPAAGELLRSLSGALKLKAMDREFDSAVESFMTSLGTDPLRDAFLADYVGFPVYDVLLYLPGTMELGPDPLTRVQVERISPQDSKSLKEVFGGLKSRNLMGFLGFFNRAYREHDYLWGRLNSADRLVDLLANVVPKAFAEGEAEAFKRRLFSVIVARERRRLYRCDEELSAIDSILEEP